MTVRETYKAWRKWYRYAPFSLKIFVWILFLNPLIATTYNLKETGVSPLQIFGVIVFCISVFYTFELNRPYHFKSYHNYFILFSVLIVSNYLFHYMKEEITLSTVGYYLRTITPVFLFLYLRKAIRTKSDLDGLLFSYLLSSVFPLIMMGYEIIFGSINPSYISESRGGGIRLSGLYADNFNYIGALIGSYMVISYYMIKKINRLPSFMNNKKMLIIIFLFSIAIFFLSHQATWGVFIMMNLFLFFNFTRTPDGRRYAYLFFIALVIGLAFFSINIFNQLFSKEIEVLSGNLDEGRAFNGRWARWVYYFGAWNNEFPFYTKFFGVAWEDNPLTYPMTSGLMHNDFVRILFTTGFIGLISYLIFYLGTYYRSTKLHSVDKFLLQSAMMIILLFSISSNPFMGSAPLLCLLIMILAAY